jgi:hypothetical protein
MSGGGVIDCHSVSPKEGLASVDPFFILFFFLLRIVGVLNFLKIDFGVNSSTHQQHLSAGKGRLPK